MRHRSRLLFSFVLCVALSSTAHAQQSMASETFKQRLRGQYLHNDTAQAVINLYSKRQMGGAGWVFASFLTAIRIASSPNSANLNGAVTTEPAPVGAAFVVATPFLAYGVGKIIHYSNGRLKTILTDYAAGKPLARSVRRKLKPRFFAQPIVKYQRVPVQAAPGQKAPAPAATGQPVQKKPAQVEPIIQAAPTPVLDNARPTTDAPALPVQQAPAQAAPELLTK